MTPQIYIPLESIQIATPCRADWEQMTGDDKTRFCGTCAKNVYNLSAMSRAEAERLIREKEGQLCVQLHRRADGTVLTSDCPVGISPVQRSANWLRKTLVGAMAVILGVFGVQSSYASKQTVRHTMGRTLGAPMPMTGIVAPQPLRGEIAVPTATPAPTAALTKKNHGHRVPRKPTSPRSSQHR